MKLEIRLRALATSFLLVAAAGCGSASAAEESTTESATSPTTPSSTTTGATVTPATNLDAPAPAATLGTVTSPLAPAAVAPAAVAMPYRGVNLAGAEFGDTLPGVAGADYKFPNPNEVDYFIGKGMNTFRVGFKWERLQPQANGDLVQTYVAELDALVNYATARQTTVILNPHNFARYYGNTVGSTQVPNAVFADLWHRLATRYGQNPRVMFNLVNEPHDLPTEQWVGAANAAIAAIRSAGATNTIIVPGNAWTGAHAWTSNSYGTPNSVAMLDITDPGNNVLFEVHQYLDANSGGASGPCVSGTIGSERLAGFVKWLRDNGKKGFVGEFAGRNDDMCNAAVTDMLTYMHANSDVLVGWLWWAAGPGWGDYVFSLEPKDGADRPAMALIKPFLF